MPQQPQMYNSASTLADILTQRRLEARQDMLDQLNAEHVRAQIDAAKETTAANRAWREGQQELAKATAGRQFLTQFGMGQDVSPEGMARAKDLGVSDAFTPARSVESAVAQAGPPTLEAGPQTSFKGPNGEDIPSGFNPDDVAPGPEAIQAGPGPKPAQFRGSLKERQDAESDRKAEAFLNDPASEKLDPLQKAILYQQITGKQLPAGAMKTDQSGKTYTFDQATGKYSLASAEDGSPIKNANGDRVVSRSRPPANSTQTTNNYIQKPDGTFELATDPDGNPIHGRIVRPPSAGGGGSKDLIPPALLNKLTDMKAKAKSSGGLFGSRGIDPQSQAAIDQSVRNIVLGAKVPPHVQEAVLGALQAIKSHPGMPIPSADAFVNEDWDEGDTAPFTNLYNLLTQP